MMRCGPLLLAGIFFILYPAVTWGMKFYIMPSLAVKEEYNGNILLLADDIREDYISTISPGFEVVSSTERLDTDMQIRINNINYYRNSELNATDQEYSGRLKYLITPLFSMSAEASFVKDSRPDRDIDITGIALSYETRDRTTSSLSADYLITERAVAGMSYRYSRDDFESQSNLNYVSHNVAAGLVYDLGEYLPLLKGLVNVGYLWYDAQYSTTDNITGRIGLSRKIDEFWGIQIEGGFHNTWSYITVIELQPFPVSQQEENTSQGWVGQMAVNYKGERGSGSFSFSRDVLPASGLGGVAERNFLTLSSTYQFTYKLSLFFTTYYYTNRSDAYEFSMKEIDQQSFHVTQGWRYEFTKDMAAEASYEYIRFDDSVAVSETGRHLISVRFMYSTSFLN